jgi:hypothetical protein
MSILDGLVEDVHSRTTVENEVERCRFEEARERLGRRSFDREYQGRPTGEGRTVPKSTNLNVFSPFVTLVDNRVRNQHLAELARHNFDESFCSGPRGKDDE